MADSPISSRTDGTVVEGAEPRAAAFDDALRLGLWTVFGVFVALTIVGVADLLHDLQQHRPAWVRLGVHLGIGLVAGGIVTILRGLSRRRWSVAPGALTLRGWGRRDGTYAVQSFFVDGHGDQAVLVATVEAGFDAVLTRGSKSELTELVRALRAAYGGP